MSIFQRIATESPRNQSTNGPVFDRTDAMDEALRRGPTDLIREIRKVYNANLHSSIGLARKEYELLFSARSAWQLPDINDEQEI